MDDLEFVLNKSGFYITATDFDEIISEFELKAGESMTFEQFKQIILCIYYLGFSSENSADVHSLAPPTTLRRLSHKRLSSRKQSMNSVVNKNLIVSN